jgi:signal transduction histidine kinase
MNLLRTTTFQLTLAYALILAVSSIAVAAFLYWSTIGYLARQTDSTIEVEITGLREQYRSTGLNGLSRVINDRMVRGDDPDALYLFADRQLRPLAGNIEVWPDLVERADGWYSFTNNANGEAVMARARVYALSEGLLLLVGRRISDLDVLLRQVGTALGWGASLVIAFSLLGGLFMSKRVMKRVESINVTTRKIITGDMSQRVMTRGTGDEFDRLAEILNRMLTQNEHLMAGIQHVGDSIAHDLRTPLTRLRHALEEAANSDKSDEMRARLEAAIDDADRLLATFSALLRIARIESGGYSIRKEPVSLNVLVSDAIEMYEVIAQERSITVSSDMQEVPDISGDRHLIFQLISNLVDNAIKYTPRAGKVHLAVSEVDGEVVLSVSDTGSGITEEERGKVTQRFYRVDSSRNKPGSGLGLSLVEAVAISHGARLILLDQSPGLRV